MTQLTTTSIPRLAVPRRHRRTSSVVVTALIVVGLVALHVWAWRKTDFSLGELVTGWHGMVEFIGEALPPNLSWNQIVKPGIGYCGVTLAMGILGTTLSVPFALVLAVLGARTTQRNPIVYQSSRAVLSFFRAVPNFVWALIFVTAVGLGSFPGVLAILVHNIGVMGKLWSEAMEEVDEGPVEALRSAGASNVQTANQVVLPSALPQFVSLFLYRIDVNVRDSVMLGIVGAGGIGFYLTQAIQEFNFDVMMTYILMVLVMVVAVDLLSGALRKRLSRA
jgi:phosphonate transport system permease protein